MNKSLYKWLAFVSAFVFISVGYQNCSKTGFSSSEKVSSFNDSLGTGMNGQVSGMDANGNIMNMKGARIVKEGDGILAICEIALIDLHDHRGAAPIGTDRWCICLPTVDLKTRGLIGPIAPEVEVDFNLQCFVKIIGNGEVEMLLAFAPWLNIPSISI